MYNTTSCIAYNVELYKYTEALCTIVAGDVVTLYVRTL